MSDKLPPCDHDCCPPTHCRIAALERELASAKEALNKIRDNHDAHTDDQGYEIEQDYECFCSRCLAVRALKGES